MGAQLPRSYTTFYIPTGCVWADYQDGYVTCITTDNYDLSTVMYATGGWSGTLYNSGVFIHCIGY